MGCDIHLYREKNVNGEWLAADKWTDDGDYLRVEYQDQYFTDRNYQLFGLLAKGVREEHDFSFVKRGLPFDACREIKQCSDDWDCDGHSHSYLFLHELKAILAFTKSQKVTVSGMKDSKELEALNESIASGKPNWDLLWPYCRFTNMDGHEHFELEVPASLYFEDGLERIIAGFYGVEGDNHRIVFFFDN
jgi:hypothetical protein